MKKMIVTPEFASYPRDWHFSPYVCLKRHLKTFMKVKDELISAPYPAWTAVGASELITEGTLAKMRCASPCRHAR